MSLIEILDIIFSVEKLEDLVVINSSDVELRNMAVEHLKSSSFKIWQYKTLSPDFRSEVDDLNEGIILSFHSYDGWDEVRVLRVSEVTSAETFSEYLKRQSMKTFRFSR